MSNLQRLLTKQQNDYEKNFWIFTIFGTETVDHDDAVTFYDQSDPNMYCNGRIQLGVND